MVNEAPERHITAPRVTNRPAATDTAGRLRWRLAALGAFVVALLISSRIPQFLTLANLATIGEQSASLGLMSIGLSFVLVGGGIDLSIPAVMGLSGTLGAIFMIHGNVIVGVLLMVVVGCIVGAFNGYAVAYLKMAPFAVTFATFLVANAIAVLMTKNVNSGALPSNFINAVTTTLVGIPLAVVAFVIIIFFATLVAHKSIFGRKLYATGTNERTSRIAGLATQRVLWSTYAIAGLTAGVAAIVLTGQQGAASASFGSESVILTVVAACVVGGVSIDGGIGSPLGAAIGAVIISAMANAFVLLNIGYSITLIVEGTLIVILVAADKWRRLHRVVHVG